MLWMKIEHLCVKIWRFYRVYSIETPVTHRQSRVITVVVHLIKSTHDSTCWFCGLLLVVQYKLEWFQVFPSVSFQSQLFVPCNSDLALRWRSYQQLGALFGRFKPISGECLQGGGRRGWFVMGCAFILTTTPWAPYLWMYIVFATLPQWTGHDHLRGTKWRQSSLIIQTGCKHRPINIQHIAIHIPLHV